MCETSDCPESSTRRLFIEQAVPIVFVDHVLFHVGFLDALGGLLGATIGEEETVHFRTQSDKFDDRDTVQFVFEKTDDFRIFLAVEWVLDRIIRSVVVLVDFWKHVSIQIRRGDVINQTVSVREEKASPVTILSTNDVIVEPVHLEF